MLTEGQVRQRCTGTRDARPSAMRPALIVILLLGLGGVAFSGHLTYGELFTEGGANVSSPGLSAVLGLARVRDMAT